MCISPHTRHGICSVRIRGGEVDMGTEFDDIANAEYMHS